MSVFCVRVVCVNVDVMRVIIMFQDNDDDVNE